jgi:hypothetical protein
LLPGTFPNFNSQKCPGLNCLSSFGDQRSQVCTYPHFSKVANKVVLEAEKEKDSVEKSVEEMKRQFQPKRTRTHDDVGHGSPGVMHDYDCVGVHVWDVIGIGGNVSSLREDRLGEEVGYRSEGVWGR